MSRPEAMTHAAREIWEKVEGWEAAATRDDKATFGLDVSEVLLMPTYISIHRRPACSRDRQTIFRIVSCPTGRL